LKENKNEKENKMKLKSIVFISDKNILKLIPYFQVNHYGSSVKKKSVISSFVNGRCISKPWNTKGETFLI